MPNQLANGRAAEILLAEGNDNDVELTRQGFKRAKLLVNLHRVRDGEEMPGILAQAGSVRRCSDARFDSHGLKYAQGGRGAGLG
jgi:hypothetical protein